VRYNSFLNRRHKLIKPVSTCSSHSLRYILFGKNSGQACAIERGGRSAMGEAVAAQLLEKCLVNADLAKNGPHTNALLTQLTCLPLAIVQATAYINENEISLVDSFITEGQRIPHQLPQEKFFNVHRLVQMASVWWLKQHGEWTTWTGKAAARIENLVPYGGHEGKEVWTAYLPHAIHLAALDTVDETTKASILDRVGRCEASLGRFAAAEATHRQVLAIRENNLGKEHRDTLTSKNELGVALDNKGSYKESESMHRQTLAAREKVLGVEHPDTLQSMNLASVLARRGKYSEAELMHRQTLVASEKVLGVEHPFTLTSMTNLASTYRNQGRWSAAEELEVQVMEIRKKKLGPTTQTR
jgi:tetratricopeptide (TPR) repeat protein